MIHCSRVRKSHSPYILPGYHQSFTHPLCCQRTLGGDRASHSVFRIHGPGESFRTYPNPSQTWPPHFFEIHNPVQNKSKCSCEKIFNNFGQTCNPVRTQVRISPQYFHLVIKVKAVLMMRPHKPRSCDPAGVE